MNRKWKLTFLLLGAPALAGPGDTINKRGKLEQSQREVTNKVVVVKQQNNRQAQKQYRKWMKGQRFDS